MMMSLEKVIVQGGLFTTPICTNHTNHTVAATKRVALPRIFEYPSLSFSDFRLFCKTLNFGGQEIQNMNTFNAEAETNVASEFEFRQSITKNHTISLNDLLFTDNRDYLIKNNHQQVRAEQLEGKVIGIYFVPLTKKIRAYTMYVTTLLKDIYDDLRPINNFEVVLIACNDLETDYKEEIPAYFSLHSDAQKLFQDLFSYMPWTAIPFSDVTSRKRIQRSFGMPETIMFIPRLYIVDQTGMVLQCCSWDIFESYRALGYPFSDKRLKFLRTEDYLASQQPSLKALLGSPERDYVISNNGDKVPIHTFEDKVVALYFYNPDCPYSPTKELKLAYEEFAKIKKIFEVVLVYIREPGHYGWCKFPFLKSEESFWEEFKTMPWLALPFKDMSYEKLKRVFEFKGYGASRLVIFGPHAEYIEPICNSMLLRYGNRAFPFRRKNKLEMEIEKLKELNLGKLWDPNSVFRRNDGSQVLFSQLLRKRVMVVLDSFDSLKRIDASSKKRITKFLTMLKEKYIQTKGTDDEFEVIRILINNSESLIYKDLVGDMPWFVSPASELLYDLGSSSFWHGINTFCLLNYYFPILAFDLDGRLVRKTQSAEFEDIKFPFHAGGLEEERSSCSSTPHRKYYSWCSEDIFRYNGRIYK